ncbi:MAG TPA: NAD-dependent epimerase/dehydratase family protein [Chloroflexota bacterium]|nr:NAD-dependent epimerase/dehydratase family protein [Chloroflexota bacterium]
MKTVAITGASGYVGSTLARHFGDAGWNVVRMIRSTHQGGDNSVPFRLGDELAPDGFRRAQVHALVHCAYDFRPVTRDEIHEINVEGSRKLLMAAQAGGVERIVVMSSISAFTGCRSLYGRAKLEIEAAAAAAGALAIRAGLVYGDGPPAGGMFGSLATSVQRGLVPLIDGGIHPQYLIHEEDLWSLVKRFCDGDLDNPGKPVVAASARGWPLRDLLAAIARRQGRHPRFLSVPWQPVWAGLRLAELAHLPVQYRSDSVVSLVYQDRNPDFKSLAAVGITAREFSPG